MRFTGGKASSQDRRRARLLPELKVEIGKNGHLSKDALSRIAGQAGIPIQEVFGVATFYSYLPVSPVGRNMIKVCQCLPCELKDSRAILESLRKELGIAPGETTGDGRFSLELVNCIGACDQAPAMMINDRLHGNLNPDRIAEILKSY